jgi:hypothetical protein
MGTLRCIDGFRRPIATHGSLPDRLHVLQAVYSARRRKPEESAARLQF